MGCIESCFKKKDDEPDERTSLLQGGNNPALPNSNPITAEVHEQEVTPVGSMSQSRQDEQSLLNGILTKYSSDMVDITGMDMRVDAVEYMNRVTLYNRKLAALGGRLEVRKPPLRSACSNPVSVLSAPPPPAEHLAFIQEVSEEVATAMSDVKIVKKQNLTIDLAEW